eukprot:458973_1
MANPLFCGLAFAMLLLLMTTIFDPFGNQYFKTLSNMEMIDMSKIGISDRLHYAFFSTLGWILYCFRYIIGVRNYCYDDEYYQKKIFQHLEKQHMNLISNTTINTKTVIIPITEIYYNTSNISSYSYQLIYELTNHYTKPIIFRNLLSDSFGVQNHNIPYLLKHYSEYNVSIRDHPFDYDISSDLRSRFPFRNTSTAQKCRKSKYITTVKKYFENNENNRHHKNDYISFAKMDDLLIESNILKVIFGDNHLNKHIKMGALILNDFSDVKPSATLNEYPVFADFHVDIGPFIFAQTKGCRYWRLINPEFSHLMKPINYGPYSYSHIFSDMRLFKSIPRYQFELHEGDILFMPSWYWHEVRGCHILQQPVSWAYSLRMFHLVSNLKLNPIFTINAIWSHISPNMTALFNIKPQTNRNQS